MTPKATRISQAVWTTHTAVVILAVATAISARAATITTTDAATAAAFQTGATIERFDDLAALLITSYGAGQTVGPAEQFSSRNGATHPTFHSGGASPNDPVGNPGTPIGIFAPSGGISGDVVSPNNVAGPLVINESEAFNFGFMEVIFPAGASSVGFWVTFGQVVMDLRDLDGNPLVTGDTSINGSAGQFIGISRDAADVRVAAIVGVTEAFTIDDFTYVMGTSSSPSVPEPGSVAGGLLASLFAGAFLRVANRRMKPGCR
jgi:hypothetical protein